MAKVGFYAVQKGRTTGVFTSWAECEASTKGFVGAVYKKFATAKEAEGFVASSSGYSRKRDDEPSSNKRVRREDATFKRPDGVKTIVAYCDGSSLGNGKTGARAGWGVYFEDAQYHGLNEARRLPGPVQTNNRAELMALIRAIQLVPNKDAQLVIFTDSQYSMDCVDKWISGWRRKGWKIANGENVLNKDLIRRLDLELRQSKIRPRLEYVKGHAGIYGNEIVDKLAKHGATLPEEFDSESLEPPPSDEKTPLPFEKAVTAFKAEVKAPLKKTVPVEAPFKKATPAKPAKRKAEQEVKAQQAELDIHPDDLLTAEELKEIEKGL